MQRTQRKRQFRSNRNLSLKRDVTEKSAKQPQRTQREKQNYNCKNLCPLLCELC
jgi:hypothetical protein